MTDATVDAEHFHQRLGWTRAAEIPRYADLPDGTLASTTIYFTVLS